MSAEGITEEPKFENPYALTSEEEEDLQHPTHIAGWKVYWHARLNLAPDDKIKSSQVNEKINKLRLRKKVAENMLRFIQAAK